MLNDKDYMTLVDAAKALGISRQWLYERVINGTAPAHITIGKRRFFERSAVSAEYRLRNKHRKPIRNKPNDKTPPT